MKSYLLLMVIALTSFMSTQAARDSVESLIPVILRKDDRKPYSAEMEVELQTSTGNYTLSLSMNKMLMPKHFTSIAVANGIETIDKTLYENCYYQGEVKDHPDWIVTMSACNGLRGKFGNPEDVETFFHLEPMDQFNPSMTQLHTFYVDKEYMKSLGKCGCDDEIEHHPNLNGLMSLLGSMRDNERVRRQSSMTRYVELAIVNDFELFLAQGEDVAALTQRSLGIANSVDMLYSSLNIRIILTRVITITDGNSFPSSGESGRLLLNFEDYVEATQINKPYDSIMLFTGTDLEDSVVGRANLGTMCDRRKSISLTQDTGFSTMILAVIAAHELGHVFGMLHDNIGNECPCPEETCIMAVGLSVPFPMSWSTCSIDTRDRFYREGGDRCLFNTPVPLVLGQPTCGDGIVEGNETCDCGYPAECTNVCCNASTCQVADGMECATGECCTGQCRVKRYGTECRPSTSECDIAEYCLGDSNECPEDEYVADGLSCQSNSGYCLDGACPTHAEQCRVAFDSNTGHASCFDRNMAGYISGNCGQNSTEFQPCDARDILCGKLQCMEGNYTGIYGESGNVTTINTIDGTCNGFTDEVGLGLVRDGTKCGEAQVCELNLCMALDKPLSCPLGNNSAECSGSSNGICNNQGMCFCLRGFTGIACEEIRSISNCGALLDPVNGQVSHPVTSEGGYADYSCNPGFFLVGAPFRRCLSSGLWAGTEPACEEYNVTLVFGSSTASIIEPVNGETVSVEYCFEIVDSTRQVSDAIFDVNVLPSSNASNADFYLNTSIPLVIETGLKEDCIELIVIGDGLMESLEAIHISIDARSEFDRVLFQPFSSTRFLVLNIADYRRNFLPFGEEAGDSLVLSEDVTSSALQATPNFAWPLFGKREDTIYVNINGVLSFGRNFTNSTPSSFPISDAVLVAPFWDNIAIIFFGEVFYRFSRDPLTISQVAVKINDAFGEDFSPILLFIATWNGVVDSGVINNTMTNSFQVILASDGEQTYAMFLYREIELDRDNTTVGFNAGDGIRFYDLYSTASMLVLERDSNVNESGTYIFRVDQDQVIEPPGCEVLSNPKNGIVSDFTFVGSTAHYACDPGFVLVGGDTRLCLEDRSWSGMEPTCEACEDLPSPQNGTILFSGRSTAQYSCDFGFYLVGEDTRVCFENASWSGTAPTCREYDVILVLDYETDILEPTFGENVTTDVCFTAQLDSPLNRDSIFDFSLSPDATASLGDDYLLSLPTLNLTIPRGFSGTFSMCVSIIVLGDSEDEFFEAISYDVSPRSIFDHVVPDDGLVVLNILDTGNLFPYGAVAGDSMLDTTTEAVASSLAQVEMNFSFPFFGRQEDTIYVNAIGTLSFGAPFLTIFPERFPIDNSTLVAPFWHAITIYRGGNAFFRVSEDAGLIREVGAQIEAAFGELFLPELLLVATWDRVPGVLSSVTLRNSFQVVLASDGEQTYVLFLYRQIQWGQGIAVAGFNAGDGITFYSLIQFNFFFTVILERDSNVNQPGTYIFRVDQDRVILPSAECALLPHPLNGSVAIDYSSTFDGATTARYACDPGFVLVGVATRVCLTNSLWSGEAPTCDACEELFSPLNGTVVINATFGRNIAHYSCDSGFFLVGEDSRECLENASWTGTEPICEEYDVTLFVLDYETTVREPPLGGKTTNNVCVTAQLDSPLNRDSIFDVSPSPNLTASLGDDHLITSNLTIPRGFAGNFSTCINITILGDDEIESLERISYKISARSLFDRVVYPPETSADVIVVRIQDSGNFIPFGTAAGDSMLVDALDEASPAQTRTNLSCSFFGRDEDTIYVNANGMLSFRAPFNDFSPEPFPLSSSRSTLVAPFWNDIDVRQSGSIFYRFSEDEDIIREVEVQIEAAFQENFRPEVLFITTWHRVSGYARPSNMTDSFQVVLACDGEQTYVLFLYREIQWGRDRSTVGLNAGDGVRFYVLDQPNINSSLVLERNSNVNVPGTYIFRVDQEQVLVPAENNEVIVFEQPQYEIMEDIGLQNYALRICLNVSNLRTSRSIALSTISGTAQGGEDYAELARVMNLNAGETKRCFGVVIYEDQTPEADEFFFIRAEGLGRTIHTEVILLDDDNISFSFTNNSPIVRNNHVTFQLSLGGGIVEARCAVLQEDRVLSETDCSSGRAEFAILPPRFVELTPQITTTLRNSTSLITRDRSRNFRLVIGSRRRCSVHLINEGVTERNVSNDRETRIEWGLSGPADVMQSNITFFCSIDGGEEFSCVSPIILRGLSGSHALSVRPPRNSQGCIRGIPRIFNF